MDFESLLRGWDGESAVIRHDAESGAWIFIAIHSTRLGPAGGGTRMKRYATPAEGLADAQRLAAAMTKKFAVPGLPYGGGKAVIAVPPSLGAELRAPLLQRYGALVHRLGGSYITGPDVGTNSADMDVIAATGAPYVFGRSPAAGGHGDSGDITAAGVLAGLEVVCDSLFGEASVRGRTVLVQGAGSVGGALARRLAGAGAKILVCDVDGAAAEHIRAQTGATVVDAEAVYETPCDVLAPCALGGVLNRDSIARLRCRAVAGAANNQLGEPDDAAHLQRRGILYAPDYVVNVGGAMGLIRIESDGWTPGRAEEEIVASVRKALRQVLALAAKTGVSPAAAAEDIAKGNLEASPRT